MISEYQAANFSARALVITSELYSLIAILQIMSGSYLKGAYNLRKAWKSYENLAKFNEFIRNADGNQVTILEDTAYMVRFVIHSNINSFLLS